MINPSQVDHINTSVFPITFHLHLHRLMAFSQSKMHLDQLHKSAPSLTIPAVFKSIRRAGEMAPWVSAQYTNQTT